MPVRLSNPRRGFIYNVLPKYCRTRPICNPSRGCVGTLVLPCCYRYVSPNGLYRTGLVGTVTRYGFSQPYRSKHCHTLFPSFRPSRGAVETATQPATELSPLPGRCRNGGATCYRAFAPAGALPKRCHNLLPSFRPCRGVVETLAHPATELLPLSGHCRNGDTTRYRACAPDGALLNRLRNLLPRFRPCRGAVETATQPATGLPPLTGRHGTQCPDRDNSSVGRCGCVFHLTPAGVKAR